VQKELLSLLTTHSSEQSTTQAKMSRVSKTHHAGVTSASLLSAPILQEKLSNNPVIDFATTMHNE
jgi:hypothetical protein